MAHKRFHAGLSAINTAVLNTLSNVGSATRIDLVSANAAHKRIDVMNALIRLESWGMVSSVGVRDGAVYAISPKGIDALSRSGS